jgi:hypothetical protein
MATIIPSAQKSVDTLDGNFYEIYTVNHVTGTATDIAVPDACVSAACLQDDLTSSTAPVQETSTSSGITVRNQTSGASGLSFGAWATNDGHKQITIASSVATGSYKIVARFVGSAGGIGTSRSTNL